MHRFDHWNKERHSTAQIIDVNLPLISIGLMIMAAVTLRVLLSVVTICTTTIACAGQVVITEDPDEPDYFSDAPKPPIPKQRSSVGNTRAGEVLPKATLVTPPAVTPPRSTPETTSNPPDGVTSSGKIDLVCTGAFVQRDNQLSGAHQFSIGIDPVRNEFLRYGTNQKYWVKIKSSSPDEFLLLDNNNGMTSINRKTGDILDMRRMDGDEFLTIVGKCKPGKVEDTHLF